MSHVVMKNSHCKKEMKLCAELDIFIQPTLLMIWKVTKQTGTKLQQFRHSGDTW